MNQAEKERLAKVGKTFNAKAYIKNEIEAIRAQVGDRKVLLAMSGGVDSSVCAVLSATSINANSNFWFGGYRVQYHYVTINGTGYHLLGR